MGFRPKIFIRVDGSNKLGLGHVMRGLNLATGLKNILKSDITFLFRDNPVVESLLIESGFNYYILNSRMSELKALSMCDKGDIFITDSPIITTNYLSKVKAKVGLLVSIYYGGSNVYYPSDILINPNLSMNTIKCSDSTDYYGGGKYLILPASISKWRQNRKKINNPVKKLFLCFGGSDPSDLTMRLIRILVGKEYADFWKTIAVGRGYQNIECLKRAIHDVDNIELKVGLNDLSGLLNTTDLAILAGGVLMHEAGVLGVPSIIICHNQEQDEEANAFQLSGIAYNLGIHNKITNEDIIRNLSYFINDKVARKRMSVNAYKCLDDLGIERIAKIIKKRMTR